MSNILYIDEVSSTNDELALLKRKERLDEGFLLWTNHQTAGKGQIGNIWESEKDMNINMSMLFYPDFLEANRQFILSQLASVAIIEWLAEEIKSELSIKWPNDIYVGNKKIAGILIENVLSGRNIESCIIGIGININQVNFSSKAPNPISLKQITGKDYSIKELIDSLRRKIMHKYIEVCNNEEAEIVEAYKMNLFRKEGYHLYKDENSSFEARIKNVQPSGHLILELKDGSIRSFAFKEVSFLLTN